MGISYNPSIVSSGLVLALDAANPKSYPGSGTTWTDLSGRGNTGTLTNGPTYNSANGGAISFDGVDDYVGTTALNLNELTICAWVKFSSVSNTAFPTIINKETSNTSRNFFMGLAPQFTFSRSVSGSDQGVISSITPNLNQWYYVASTNTLTPVFSIYINGVLNNTATFSGSLSTGGSATWIGTYRNLIYPMNGNIANTQIYNRALSADEISQNFNATRRRFGI